MADEQDRWLDRETAEILLRGESLEAVDPAVRDRARRLAGALGALSGPPVPTSEELPGEAAALAAFRTARAERPDGAARASAVSGPGRAGTPAPPAGAGLVRIGPRGDDARRPRWSRPLRLGLAAALTVGMVGGVAVAAGTGVLPTPFEGARPEPAATVSAPSPDRPPASPTPLDGARGGTVPGGPTTGAPERGGARGDAEGGTAPDRGRGHDSGSDSDSGARSDSDADGRATGGPGGSGGSHRTLAASCRDVRAGKQLDAGRLRALKEAAGGAGRVGTYCRDLLGHSGAAQDRKGGRGAGESGETEETAGGHGTRKDDDKGGKGGNGDRDDDSGKGDKGDKGGADGKGGKDEDEDEDDDGHIAPPVGRTYGPRAPSAVDPLPRRRPARPSHLASTAGHQPSDLRLHGQRQIFSLRV
ncbi:hypothetical protein [Streptomyces sp. BK79]|uniref:hypothetical protein n=1 Tax=Streptomyces sp. BK79 TaxID=3350097 RepID=UPI00376FC4D4